MFIPSFNANVSRKLQAHPSERQYEAAVFTAYDSPCRGHGLFVHILREQQYFANHLVLLQDCMRDELKAKMGSRSVFSAVRPFDNARTCSLPLVVLVIAIARSRLYSSARRHAHPDHEHCERPLRPSTTRML